jgi:hypothetical protein
MAGVIRVGLENAVGRGVVSSSVHSIGTSSVERGRKANIASLPACDCDFTHDCGILYVSFLVQLKRNSVKHESRVEAGKEVAPNAGEGKTKW